MDTITTLFQSHVDHYREKALRGERAEFSGRTSEQNTFVAKYVLSRLSLDADDTLADVGCGDGMLLRLAPCREEIGFTATQEEAICLSNENFPVRQSLLEKIALPSEFADVTVCHDVLSLVSRKKIPNSLAELARITKTDGAIWIGEIPEKPEVRGWRRVVSPTVFTARPQDFVSMANDAGLELLLQERNRQIDKGVVKISETRWNYLFNKI